MLLLRRRQSSCGNVAPSSPTRRAGGGAFLIAAAASAGSAIFSSIRPAAAFLPPGAVLTHDTALGAQTRLSGGARSEDYPVGCSKPLIWQSTNATKTERRQEPLQEDGVKEVRELLSDSGWEPLVVLGKGSFGSCAIVEKDSTLAVAKVALKREELLTIEYDLLRSIQRAGGKGFAEPLAFRGKTGKVVLIQQLLGPNLKELRALMGGSFSLKTTLMVASQLLHRLEFLHRNNICYGDLKPDNVCVGLEDASNTIYLIDFGLVRPWRDSATHAVASPLMQPSRVGNKMFFGVWHRSGLPLLPRDDVLSLGFLMLGLHVPERWNFRRTDSDYVDMVARLDLHDLCRGLPNEIEEFLSYCKNLAPTEPVNYSYLQKLLESAFSRCSFVPDGRMDWSAA